jgi:hypothetical protein
VVDHEAWIRKFPIWDVQKKNHHFSLYIGTAIIIFVRNLPEIPTIYNNGIQKKKKKPVPQPKVAQRGTPLLQ